MVKIRNAINVIYGYLRPIITFGWKIIRNTTKILNQNIGADGIVTMIAAIIVLASEDYSDVARTILDGVVAFGTGVLIYARYTQIKYWPKRRSLIKKYPKEEVEKLNSWGVRLALLGTIAIILSQILKYLHDDLKYVMLGFLALSITCMYFKTKLSNQTV